MPIDEPSAPHRRPGRTDHGPAAAHRSDDRGDRRADRRIDLRDQARSGGPRLLRLPLGSTSAPFDHRHDRKCGRTRGAGDHPAWRAVVGRHAGRSRDAIGRRFCPAARRAVRDGHAVGAGRVVLQPGAWLSGTTTRSGECRRQTATRTTTRSRPPCSTGRLGANRWRPTRAPCGLPTPRLGCGRRRRSCARCVARVPSPSHS